MPSRLREDPRPAACHVDRGLAKLRKRVAATTRAGRKDAGSSQTRTPQFDIIE